MKKKFPGELALLTSAFLWGSGFIAVQEALNGGFSPFSLLAVRGCIGGCFLGVFSLKYKWWKNKKIFKDGMIAGVLMFLAFVFQTYGQQMSTVSNAAFLTTLYVVFTPLILKVFFKRKMNRMIYIGAALALIGTALLSLDGSLVLKVPDVLLIICAILFALHIIYLESLGDQYSALALTTIQLFTMSILSCIFVLPTQTTGIHGGYMAVVYCGIVSSGIAFFLQTYGQKLVSSSMASLILTLESVFGVLFSMLIFHEVLTPQMWLGGAILLIAVLIVNKSEGNTLK